MMQSIIRTLSRNKLQSRISRAKSMTMTVLKKMIKLRKEAKMRWNSSLLHRFKLQRIKNSLNKRMSKKLQMKSKLMANSFLMMMKMIDLEG